MDKLVYIVRLPNGEYKAEKGTTKTVSEAKRYESEGAATQSAGDRAIGLSEYKVINDQLQPQRHISLTKAKPE